MNNINDTGTVFHDRDQTWRITWHPTQTPPVGRRHGANGVCVTEDGGIVLISEDGQAWDFPGGRPEGDETWEETLRREVVEEACATTQDARLLGFCCAECLAGAQVGEVLVRSFWLARVVLGAWEPKFEITHRRVVRVPEVCGQVRPEYGAIYWLILIEAGMTPDS